MDRKILVVDDEVTILMMLREAFEEKGYEVVTAQSGEEALEILKKEKFKVMFLDLKLPGMDGLELCRIIRNDQPDTKIFAITGYPSLFEHSNCLAAGFDGYFIKPMNLNEILDNASEAFADLEKQEQTLKM